MGMVKIRWHRRYPHIERPDAITGSGAFIFSNYNIQADDLLSTHRTCSNTWDLPHFLSWENFPKFFQKTIDIFGTIQ
jgi:hypothetical protein